ncbi:putative phage tail protein [Cohnella algarum]|uniref:putative phage tail protein n=1 Tax=Cohnella algarum TaxID=2044859 RepID=UPI00196780EE|nr:putative phage tail protein [Cohnella algarum]MBN2981966.1 DUF2313 domain-containing protein [Cohnella algarum]
MTEITSERGKEMLGYLPGFYEQSKVMASILDAQGLELDRLREALDGTLEQFFVVTATWGLRYWEETVGLPVSENDDADTRRRRILAKLRGSAPFSASVLRSVAEAYTQKPVSVTMDAAAHTIVFTFENAFITDPSFYTQIENLIHAHLGTAFRALFVYPGSLELAYEFRRYVYGIPFAGGTLCGTWPEPSTRGRLYDPALTVAQSYERSQRPYRFAGKAAAGSEEELETLFAEGATVLTASGAAERATKNYRLAGQANAGTGVKL